MPHFQIPCLIVQQRTSASAPKFALFAAPASEVLKWAAVRRREDDPAGPQRRLSRAKINAIKRFLQLDDRNTIPPAVTVTLEIEPASIIAVDQNRPEIASMHVLEFDVQENAENAAKPGLVIDGQHRLIGLAEFHPTCQVNVVALMNVPDMEKAFQFLVINNKVTRVPSDLIRTLALDYQAQQLDERLRTARLTLDENLPFVGIVDTDEGSPFRNHVALVSHLGNGQQRFVPPAAIESSLAMIQKKGARELESKDALCEFFYAIWSPIKQNWGDLWTEGSKLMHKVSIEAVTTYMSDALIAKYDWDELDIADPAAVRDACNRILSSQSKDLWTSEWTMRISDAKVVRDKIVDSLTKISRNLRSDQPWHHEVDMVVIS